MSRVNQQGFTAVELLVTLFIAAAFLIAGYQLFSLVVRDGGATRAEAKAANVAYDYLRKYAPSVTNPCSTQTLQNNVPITVSGLVDVRITVTAACANTITNTLSKLEATVTYNNPQETVRYATYVNK